MKVMSWNVRGLNKSHKQLALKNYVLEHKIDVLLLQETKMKKANFDNIAKYLWLGATYSYSDADGASGGLVVLWNPLRFNGSELFYYWCSVGVYFAYPGDSWLLINVYAPNQRNARNSLWQVLFG